MIVRIFAMVPATILALGTATAVAQPAANPFGQFGRANLIDQSTWLRPFDEAGPIVANAAFVSDGRSPSYLPDQQAVLREPGYSIGTGAAELGHAPATIGDGSDPSYLREQQAVVREPGYSIGTGAAPVSGAG
jgi:hypothetical protein